VEAVAVVVVLVAVVVAENYYCPLLLQLLIKIDAIYVIYRVIVAEFASLPLMG
jgi:protein-disulfide isomerase